jgi:hypothetical protein
MIIECGSERSRGTQSASTIAPPSTGTFSERAGDVPVATTIVSAATALA